MNDFVIYVLVLWLVFLFRIIMFVVIVLGGGGVWMLKEFYKWYFMYKNFSNVWVNKKLIL